ncbi:MAG: alpha/beta hydrolase [Acidobacteria bacterium]|nr:alpha/beta hydrolase [Acidobacteriota bacterium]
MQRLETLILPGPAGRIECLLKHPAPATAGGAAAAICHPHPLFGGTMHNKVVHAAAEAIVAAGIPVLRFNFRGVGLSTGAHDNGNGEQEDLVALLDYLAGRFPGRPLLAAGYSFGAYVGLRAGCRDRRVAALIGIGIPLTMVNFDFLQDCDRPLSLIQGEADPFCPPGLLLPFAAALPGGARVAVIKEAGHDFAGRLEELAARIGEAIPDGLRGVVSREERPV